MWWAKTSAIPLQSREPAAVGAHDRMDGTDWTTVAELYEQYRTDVFRYVFRRVPRQEEAEDITAQVFVAAYEGLGRFRGQCSLHLWLLGIARRQVALALRQQAGRRETIASDLVDEAAADPLAERLTTADGPEVAVMRSEARRMLDELLAQLNPDQREALMLHYIERLSIAEVAVVMGRSVASTNSLLQRARASVYRRGRAYFLPDEEEGN